MSKSVALMLILAFLTASCVITFLPVQAEGRAIVVPDDYPTIVSAIGNATAGDTIYVRKGTYEGPINQTVVIDKTLSLIGENVEGAIINLHPKYNEILNLTSQILDISDAIVIDADDVRFLNLTLTFMGDIRVNGDRTQIIGNSMKSHVQPTGLIISGSYCNIANNIFSGRINLVGSSNAIIKNTMYYLKLQSADWNIVDSNTFQTVGLTFSHNNIISKNNISIENFQHAIYLGNSTSNVFLGNHIKASSWNSNLGLFQSKNNTFYNNAFINEGELVHIYTTAYSNFWDNGINGNFWSNYDGADANGDGIGDTPYVVYGDNVDRYPLMTSFDIDGVTFELPEWAILNFESEQVISILSLQNTIYNTTDVPLNFTVPTSAKWVRYSLDGQANVTVTGNTTLTALANGSHNLTLYVDDPFGNTRPSETIHFNIDVPVPFPTTLVIAVASAVSVAVIGAGLLVYFKKRKR